MKGMVSLTPSGIFFPQFLILYYSRWCMSVVRMIRQEGPIRRTSFTVNINKL